jgi:hypothetical protein
VSLGLHLLIIVIAKEISWGKLAFDQITQDNERTARVVLNRSVCRLHFADGSYHKRNGMG